MGQSVLSIARDAVQDGQNAVVPLPALDRSHDQQMGISGVAPSISSALDWLNRCVSERPNLKLQVLSPL